LARSKSEQVNVAFAMVCRHLFGVFALFGGVANENT